MSKQFDITAKQLIETDPMAWIRFLKLPGTHATVVEADLSLVSADADKIIVVDEPFRYGLHIELQAGYEKHISRRVARYAIMADDKLDLPILSVLVLLRPDADGPSASGIYRRSVPVEPDYLTFNYRVLRVWEHSPDDYLSSGLGIVPLAALASASPKQLPEIVNRIEDRVYREADPTQAKDLMAATYVLVGLIYPADFVDQLIKGAMIMRESATFQKVLAEERNEGWQKGRQEGRQAGRQEGRVLGARETLLRLGRKRFGEPDLSTLQRVTATEDADKLETLAERALDVESWADLFAAVEPEVK